MVCRDSRPCLRVRRVRQGLPGRTTLGSHSAASMKKKPNEAPRCWELPRAGRTDFSNAKPHENARLCPSSPRGSPLTLGKRHAMPSMPEALSRSLSRLRIFVSFFLVAAAQFLSPAAAADPASKIDPPAWSHRHSKEELQAYGARAPAQQPEKRRSAVIREARLRRILRQRRSGK